MRATFGFDPDTDVGRRYLSREPESLVIGGYRGWLRYAIERDPTVLQEIWNTLNQKLDAFSARTTMKGLERLIRELGACSTCPLRFHCQSATHLCRDECLILALISGLQSGEDEAAFLSARGLVPHERTSDILNAGGELAMAMKAAGKMLLPVDANTVRWLSCETNNNINTTLH